MFSLERTRGCLYVECSDVSDIHEQTTWTKLVPLLLQQQNQLENGIANKRRVCKVSNHNCNVKIHDAKASLVVTTSNSTYIDLVDDSVP
jgi:hypothetical protein